jgi:hypothetical protein
MQARIVTWKNGGLSLYVHDDYANTTYIASFPPESLFRTHTLWPGGQWNAALSESDPRKDQLADVDEIVSLAKERALEEPMAIPQWMKQLLIEEAGHRRQTAAKAEVMKQLYSPPHPKPTREVVVIEDKRTFKQLLRDFIGRY